MGDIAAYIRVSTEKQKEDESHVRQRERIKEWAGHDDIDFYEDIAISGRDDDRPEFQDLMGCYEDYEAVVVRELSRFGRSPEQNVQQIIEITESDADFISIKEEIDTTTANGRLFLRILSAFNGWFAEQRRETALAAAQRRRENGEPLGRPKKLDPEQIDEVEDLREKGVSYSAIARIMEDDPNGPESISARTIARYCDG